MHRVSCIQPICISHLLDHDHHRGLGGCRAVLLRNMYIPIYYYIIYIYAYIHNSIFIMSIIHIYVKISKSMDASRISADSPRPFCGRSTARTSLELCERFAKLVHSMTDDSSSQVVRCLRPTSANANFKDSLCLLKQRHGVIHPRIGSLSHFDTFGCLPAFNQPLKTEDTWTVKPQEWVCNP